MNILIGSNVHWWNAEAAYAAVTAKMLHDSGHKVYVLTLPKSDNAEHLKDLGLKVIIEPDLNSRNPLVLFSSYFKLLEFLVDHQIEIVNAHRSEGFPLFVLARRFLGSFSLIRTRGASRKVIPHILNQKMYRDWIDAMIVPGKIIIKRDLLGIHISSEKLHVIYYPVDLPKKYTSENKHDYHKEFQIPLDHKVIVVVGRIRPEKGHRLLIRAFQIFLEEFPNTTLLILYRDTAPNHPEFQALKKMVQHFQLWSNVRFDSERKDIRELMAFADAGVVSSIDSEVICRVAVEFFSVSTPVISLPTGCLPEIVIDGVNGTIADSSNAESLSDAMSRLLKDSEKYNEMGKQARRDAETRFSPKLLLEKTMAVYQQVHNN